MYETDEGWAGGILDLIPTELAGKLTFLQDGEFQYCSLVEDRETGYLVLSYFTGDTTELYLLYRQTPESTVLTAVPLGNLLGIRCGLPQSTVPPPPARRHSRHSACVKAWTQQRCWTFLAHS